MCLPPNEYTLHPKRLRELLVWLLPYQIIYASSTTSYIITNNATITDNIYLYSFIGQFFNSLLELYHEKIPVDEVLEQFQDFIHFPTQLLAHYGIDGEEAVIVAEQILQVDTEKLPMVEHEESFIVLDRVGPVRDDEN